MSQQAIPRPPRLASYATEQRPSAVRRAVRRARLLQALRVLLAGRPATASKLWRAIGYAIVGGMLADGVAYAPFGNRVAASPGLAALRLFPGIHVHGVIELALGLALWHQLAAGRRPRLLLTLIVGYSLFVFFSAVASWFVAVPGQITVSWGVPGKPAGVVALALIMLFCHPVDPAVVPSNRSGPTNGGH